MWHNDIIIILSHELFACTCFTVFIDCNSTAVYCMVKRDILYIPDNFLKISMTCSIAFVLAAGVSLLYLFVYFVCVF